MSLFTPTHRWLLIGLGLQILQVLAIPSVVATLRTSGITNAAEVAQTMENAHPLLVAATILCALGWLLIWAKQLKLGGWLSMIGCIPFLPIGLVTFYGARLALDQHNALAFNTQHSLDSRNIKTFFARNTSKRLRIAGAITLIIGIIAAAQLGTGLVFTVGVLMLLMANWYKKEPTLVMYDHHLAIKTSPFAAARFFRLQDLGAMESPIGWRFMTPPSWHPFNRRVTILYSHFADDQRSALKQLLRERFGKSV